MNRTRLREHPGARADPLERAPDQPDRGLSSRFKPRANTAEELVTELGFAFLMAKMGWAAEPHPTHACYLQAWLHILREDTKSLSNRMIDARFSSEAVSKGAAAL
ncbi:zincin-like metallopeptidase domain-containing protein [Methylobacterium durans]|uniref:zincin-like metallopeptidase domain-containing protein n=1 Tax=Methylobacterium durans TaxID=2202825 RepID=UPI003AABC81D